jgi:hypothetical protein
MEALIRNDRGFFMEENRKPVYLGKAKRAF